MKTPNFGNAVIKVEGGLHQNINPELRPLLK